MIDLHQHPPMTMARVHARHAWILPVTARLFVCWQSARLRRAPVGQADLQRRRRPAHPWLETVARRVSFFGSTASFSSSPRSRPCSRGAVPRLALAIVVIVAGAATRRVRPQGARRPRPPGRRPAGSRHRTVVPERPSARHRGELGAHPARRRALHEAPSRLVEHRHRRVDARGAGRGQPRGARRPLAVRRGREPAARGHRRRRGRALRRGHACVRRPRPDEENRVAQPLRAISASRMTSSWNWSIIQSSRQPRNCRRLVSSIDGVSTAW